MAFHEPDSGVLSINVSGTPGDRVPFREGYIELADDEAWLVSDANAAVTAEAGLGEPIDSNRYGPVPVALLVGRIWFRYGPLHRIGRPDLRAVDETDLRRYGDISIRPLEEPSTVTSTRSRRLTFALGSALLTFSLAACGGTPSAAATSAPTSAAPAGTRHRRDREPINCSVGRGLGRASSPTGRIEVPEQGFAITLPASWTRIDLQSGDLEQIMAAAGADNPEMAELYSAQIQTMLLAVVS